MCLICFVGQLAGGGSIAFASGGVVINEVAWAGTHDNSNDEWIELFNSGDSEIDLANWKIVDDTTTEYVIMSGKIAPKGFFLIEDNDLTISNKTADALIGLSLANTGDSLVLQDAGGVVIDTVNGAGAMWPAGDATTKATMERNGSEWQTAIAGNGSLGRAGSSILGTPGTQNSVVAGYESEIFAKLSSTEVREGDQIELNLEIDDAKDFYAYGLTLNYNPSVLQFISASNGSFLGENEDVIFQAALEDGVAGKLALAGARISEEGDGVNGSGIFAKVKFKVIGAKNSDVKVEFDAGSFVSNSAGEVAVKYNALVTKVLEAITQTSPVQNIVAAEGSARFSIKLDWAPHVSGAEKYIVKRKNAKGVFEVLGETQTPTFVDQNNIIPKLEYTYQVVAVKNNLESAPVEVKKSDLRGIVGDVDRNDKVDGRDLEKLARAYGSTLGGTKYAHLVDTNYDSVIDGSDLLTFGANFGKSYKN